MATDNSPVGTIIQIKQVHLDLKDEQLRYDALMANAVTNGFFKSTRPAPVMGWGEEAWKPGITAVHNRGGFQFAEPAWMGMPIWIGDGLITGPNTVVAVEFVIGGRVGINKDSWVKVATERSVADAHVDLKKIILRKGGMLARMARLKEPLEIGTNGGGSIKG
jgi:hypothetical protein